MKKYLTVALFLVLGAVLSAQFTSVLNPPGDLAGKTIVTAEGNRTITGTFTYAVPVLFSSGSAANPGITLGTDLTTGIRLGIGSVGVSVSGTNLLNLTPAPSVLRLSDLTNAPGDYSLIAATGAAFSTAMYSFPATYPPSGPYFSNGGAVVHDGTGGLSVGTTGNGSLRFFTNSVLRGSFDTAGVFGALGAMNLGGNLNLGGDLNLANGNIVSSSLAPTIASTTGGTITISGQNRAFRVLSTVTGTTGFTLNFNTVYANAPSCYGSVGNTGGTLGTPQTFTVFTVPTQMTVVLSAQLLSTQYLSFSCAGY